MGRKISSAAGIEDGFFKYTYSDECIKRVPEYPSALSFF
jgi:hypothetical protein